MSPPETAYHDDLREYLRVVRSRKWTIVLTTAVVIAATALFTLHQTPIYRATAEVLVQPVQNPLNLFTPPTEPDMNTEQQVATSQAVADEVLKATTIAVPFSQLTKNLDVAVGARHRRAPGELLESVPARPRRRWRTRSRAPTSRSGRTRWSSGCKVAADTVRRQLDGVKGQLDTINRQISHTLGLAAC